MDEIDHELEEFQEFCLMNKPLENHLKLAVKVNLKVLAFEGQLKWKISLILSERLVIITQIGIGSFLLAHLV